MQRPTLLALLFASSCLLLPARLSAQDERPQTPAEPQQFVSITISPLHLILPIVELTGELRITDMLGLALIGGFGSVSAVTINDDDLSFTAYEFGTQLAFYPIEPFESLQIGGELLYMKVVVEDDIGDQQVEGLGAGLAIGPFVGYKLLTSIGFTFFVQGGVSFLAIKAEARNNLGESATRDESFVLPMLNLNLGWSI